MPEPTRRTTLIAALAATTLTAHAQEDDFAAEHSFAREDCNVCHVVDAKQQSPPRPLVIAMAFRNIANTRGTTATTLRVFLRTSHPKILNPVLTPEQMAIVIAKIVSHRSNRDPES
jgi:hypothetical protein